MAIIDQVYNSAENGEFNNSQQYSSNAVNGDFYHSWDNNSGGENQNNNEGINTVYTYGPFSRTSL
jgi:rhamnogalacturonyl hydrolase YesR